MALKVEERDGKGFHWVLLEAHDHVDVSDGLHYRVSRSAASPRASYWEALVLGMSELRRALSEAADSAELADGVAHFGATRDEDGTDDAADAGEVDEVGGAEDLTNLRPVGIAGAGGSGAPAGIG